MRARSAFGKAWTSIARRVTPFWNWLPRLRRWLSEPLPTTVRRTSGGLALAGLAAWLLASELRDGIRFFGLFLQLLGVGTVAYGLRKTRESIEKFEKSREHSDPELQSLKKQVARWLKRFPKYPLPEPDDVRLGAATEYGGAQPGGATLTVIQGTEPDTSVEGRLAMLEKRCDALRKQLDEVHGRITTEVSRLDTATKLEQREREGGDRENADLLKELSTGGLSIEWMGLVWLYVGIACATIPDEIAESPWVCLSTLLLAPPLAYFGIRTLTKTDVRGGR